MKKFILLLLTLLSANTFAMSSAWVNITQMNTGWNVERLNLILDRDIPNPNNCGSFTREAQADENLTNFDLILTLATSSFLTGKEIQLVIDSSSCSTGGRPRIIAINIRK